MRPQLSPVELEMVQQVFREGGCLSWQQITGEYGYGSGFVCYSGNKRLFAAGGSESFGMLYQQALSLRPKLAAKEIARRLVSVMSATPRGSKKLATMAEIEYDQYADVIKAVLKKLYEVGKIKRVLSDGKVWWAL